MKREWRIAFLAVMLLLCVAFAPGGAHGAERDIEWGRYQNSQTNNGVVGNIMMPASYSETALKWASKLVSGYTVSFTPPLIIDGDLYVASSKHVFRIDKETGEVEKQSEELMLNVGYAMNPITYDAEKDQFYVPILNGRVQCLDAETLQSKWISKEYRYNQTLSPIACKGGLVYTGIWEAEKEDGVFFCLDADTGEEVWSYTPSVDGAQAGELKHGFYWAGAYVNDNYVVVGSDDGAENGFAEAGTDAYPESAVVYSFDRRTGDVVDMITEIKGDVRSTVAYNGGFVYFVTKGGRLYKAPLGSDGKFGDASYIQLKDRYDADAMMTATPVVHNGRIYVGAAGSQGQFSADGGHFFAVISDDESLYEDSLIYTTPISGYPQAAPILSTATENLDGKVRLYFTFNAFPGGIYCLEDSADATASNHGNARLLYRPEKEMQQYCISPLCCDREGTMYYKNDSGYLMAVTKNEAWLDHISVTCNGEEVDWETAFESGLLKYSLKTPGGATSAKVVPTIPDVESMSVTVNGQPCGEGGITVPVSDEAGEVTVTVRKTLGDKTIERTYTLSIISASDNANLAGIAITDSNTKPLIVDTEDKKACNIPVGYDPQFDSGITEYVGKTYNKNKAFINVWLQAADSDSKIRVIPTSNVGNSSPNKNLNEDGTVKPASNGIRYPIYWVRGANAAEIDIEVTSPSGRNKQIYHVTLVRSNEFIDVGETPFTVTPPTAELHMRGNRRTIPIQASYNGVDVTGDCQFESTDPAVATVDEAGTVTAVAKGEAEIWVTYAQQNRRARMHVDVTELKLDPPSANVNPGIYTYPLSVELTAAYPDAEIRYVVGDADKQLDTPTATTGTRYTEPIAIDGTPGESITVKIKAIACGTGYVKSNPTEFTYTVELPQETPDLPINMVSPSPGSIYVSEDQKSQFTNLPNGTPYEALKEMLNEIETVRVVLTPGSNVEGVDNTDPDHPEIDAAVTWDGVEYYNYYPDEFTEQSFTIHGRVELPEGVKSGGRSPDIYLPVKVLGGLVEELAVNPAPGLYNVDKKVTLTCKTPGAEIYYTMTGVSGTQKYTEPLSLTAASGARKSYTIKAYAIKKGIASKTVSWNYVINKAKPAAPTTSLSAGTYKTDQKVTLKSSVSGASIYYTVTGTSGTKLFNAKTPISLTAATNTKKTYTIKAYTQKEGLNSATVTWTYVINKIKPPTTPTGFTATVNSSGKSMTVKWNAAATATSYRVAYKRATASSWTTKVVTSRSSAITKLTSGACYQVKVAPINAGGQGNYTAAKYCLIGRNTLTLTAQKKAFKYKINKLSYASGYRIRYGLKKNLSGAKTVKTTKLTNTIGKLYAKRLYYVEVTPYKIYGGKTYFGQPLLKTVKTK